MGQTRHFNKKRARIRAVKRKYPGTDTHRLASCDGKIRYSKDQREFALGKYPEGAVKFYKCKYPPLTHYHVGRAHGGKRNGR